MSDLSLRFLERSTIFKQSRPRQVDWPFQEMRRLEVLSLKRCLHLETALAKFLHRSNNHIVLRKLALRVVHERVELVGFLTRLSEITALTDLRLLTAGCEDALPIASVLLFKDSLQHLTLESRRKAIQPATIKPYTIEEFYTILSTCSKLKTLGIPITVDRTSRYIWRILGPYCPITHLHQRYHLDNSDPKRIAKARVDAKHLILAATGYVIMVLGVSKALESGLKAAGLGQRYCF